MKGPYAIQSPEIRYQHIRQLVRHVEPLSVVEVGSWLGSSAIAWAQGMREIGLTDGRVWCVDPWAPYDGGCGTVMQHMQVLLSTDAELIMAKFRENVKAAGVSDMVRTIRATWAEATELMRDPKIDILYLDGSHKYESAVHDIWSARGFGLTVYAKTLCGDDLEAMIGVDVSEEQCRKDLEHDAAPLPGGGYYHPGVTMAVWEVLKNEVTVYDGFWIAGDVNIYD